MGFFDRGVEVSRLALLVSSLDGVVLSGLRRNAGFARSRARRLGRGDGLQCLDRGRIGIACGRYRDSVFGETAWTLLGLIHSCVLVDGRGDSPCFRGDSQSPLSGGTVVGTLILRTGKVVVLEPTILLPVS